jgi:D-alanyl-D-alanine carboxypeptidase (penicillin-binding protein 5/6)
MYGTGVFLSHTAPLPGSLLMTRSRFPLRPLALAVLLLLLLPLPGGTQEVPELQVNSKRYIVLDAATGGIYAQKHADDRVAIASLTKVFTAVQALEMAPLDTLITTDESDLFGSDATVMGFGPGETYTLNDLLYGMMLPSGNDAAHAVARALGAQPGDTPEQSVDRFVGWMNQRNADMGLTNTHLVNPTGWGVEGHYSSARDVATFMSYALKFPDLVTAMGTISYTTSNGMELTNTNKLLRSYDLLEGGKTGYDDDAGYCLIEFAKRGSNTMISVTLDGLVPDDWYDDNRVLLNYALQQKETMTANNQQFAGQVSHWLDPAAAELSRAAKVGGSFASGTNVFTLPPADSTTGHVITGLPAANPDATSSPSLFARVGQQGKWIAAGTVLALLLLRGLFTFRRYPDRDTNALTSD